MAENYILGGGIAGLIYAFYNKSFKVVTPEVGGQMANQFQLGPRYLHKTEFSIKFLQDLNVVVEDLHIKTGYQTVKNRYIDIMLDLDYKQRYYMKSRGLKTLEGFDDTAMSSGKSSFTALKVDFTLLIQKLIIALEGRIILDKVQIIDSKNKEITLGSGTVLKYEKLVNTMPLNIFSSMLVRSEDVAFPFPETFKSQSVTFILLTPESNPGYDYIYVAAKSYPHHRLTFTDKGVVAEWFGIHSEEQCKKEYKDRYVDSKILYGSQIIPINFVYDLKDIKLVGRFGTWNRHWKTEKVIEVAMEDAK